MLHQETCIQAKLFNDVFGQESYPTAKWRPCWGSGFFFFFAARSRRQRGVISVTAAIRPNRCVLHSGWKLQRHTTSGRHVRLLPWSEYLCLRFKSTSEKTDPSGCPPFQGATPVINTKLKIATTKKEKCSDPSFFFSNHIIWCQNNLLACVGTAEILKDTVTPEQFFFLKPLLHWFFGAINTFVPRHPELCSPLTTSLCALSQRHLFWRWISRFELMANSPLEHISGVHYLLFLTLCR